jgi:hypothetical protein
MSGAVVFAGGRAIGVLIEDAAPPFRSDALRAARAEAFLKNPEIRQFLGWDGYLHEVQATDSSVLANALSRPVVVGQIPQEPPSFQHRRGLLTVVC